MPHATSQSSSLCSQGSKSGGLSLLDDSISLPALTLEKANLIHNLNWMADFCKLNGVELAPHGKTTMAPRLFQLQMDYGATSICLASAKHILLAYSCGIKQLFLANQLVGMRDMKIIADLFRTDHQFHDNFFCLVDSPENVERLGEYFSKEGLTIRVLLEVGVPEGRAGIRTKEQLESLLKQLKKWENHVKLVGLELYEGVHMEEGKVRKFLQDFKSIAMILKERKAFQEERIIVSGGGSLWFDVVTEELLTLKQTSDDFRIIIRPGCYIFHDKGHYYQNMESRFLASRSSSNLKVPNGAFLKPVVKLYAYVSSVPETDIAVVALGNKHTSEIAGGPIPCGLVQGPDDITKIDHLEWRVIRTFDQHLLLSTKLPKDLNNNSDTKVEVGDVISFDMSHACTTCNKWGSYLVVDEHKNVIEKIKSHFVN